MVQLPARVFVLLVLMDGLLQHVDCTSLELLLKLVRGHIKDSQRVLADQLKVAHENKVDEHRLANNRMSYNRELANEVIREVKQQESHLNETLRTEKSASRPMVNVATRANGATCEALSEYNVIYSCARVMDGNINTDWASKHQGVGAWLQIRFAHLQLVRFVIIMQRSNPLEQFKDVNLEFSDQSFQRVTLLKRSVAHHHYIRGRGWDWFATKPTRTSYILIRAVSVYSTSNNGFNEVQVWANIE